ncbi:MAG: DUF1837 domain-containing protein [Burkholderiales bacterium]|nr:DUF1837 domain-containing protein [Burkholderiales bacterium]
MSIFGSEAIIKCQSPNSKLKIYYAGFEFGIFRWKPLVKQIVEALVDFSFGFHLGILENFYGIRVLNDAANALYKIEEFEQAYTKYFMQNSEFDDIADKYKKRGEFGELILHLLLRDFHGSLPLLSKIYFKDSLGHAVHGFDAVHIAPDIDDNTKFSLWLGESKLYATGDSGVKALAKDIEEHFKIDYLRDEFSLISKKIKTGFYSLEQFKDLNKKLEYEEFLQKKEYWLNQIDSKQNLEHILSSVTIPMLCTYTSDTFNKHNDETTKEFMSDLQIEIESLEKIFKDNLNIPHPVTNLNVLLLFFPVPSKKELVKQLHFEIGKLQ